MRERRGRTHPRPILPVFLVALVVAAAAGVAFSIAESSATQGDEANAEARALEVLELRAELSWSHLDLAADFLLSLHQSFALTAAQVAEFDADREQALDGLRRLSGGSDQAAVDAGRLLEIVEHIPLEGDPFVLAALDELHGELAIESTGQDFSSVLMRQEVVVLGLLPVRVFTDPAAVRVADERSSLPHWAEAFVLFNRDGALTEPGWFGEDAADPLAGNMAGISPSLFELDAYRSIEDLTSLASLWQHDMWFVATGDQDASQPPPFELDVLRAESDAAAAEIRAIVRTDVSQLRSGLLESAESRATSTLLGRVVGALLSILAFCGFALAARRVRARLASAKREAVTDSLTAIPNRRFIESPGFLDGHRARTHHVVAMVDVDRFKLVNDTWGHNVGDRVLRLVAQHLQVAAEGAVAKTADGTGAAVRMGGDEFLVLVSGSAAVDVASLEQSMRAVSTTTEAGLDEDLVVSISVGTAMSSGPFDFDDLVTAADLELYEDKRRRQTGRAQAATDSLIVVD